MLLTRQTDYAIRAVLYLTTHPLASIAEVAKAQMVPQEYLAKIVQKLAKAGIVKTHRGMGGGISLGRPPAELNLLQVTEAIEGPIALNRCFANPGECPREYYCAVHEDLEEIQDNLAGMLSRVNFARLSRREAINLEKCRQKPNAGQAQ